jgi:hypothetical protein
VCIPLEVETPHVELRIPYVLKTNDLSEVCKAKAIENQNQNILKYQTPTIYP